MKKKSFTIKLTEIEIDKVKKVFEKYKKKKNLNSSITNREIFLLIISDIENSLKPPLLRKK